MKVVITVTRKVVYSSIVEMPRSKYRRMLKTYFDGNLAHREKVGEEANQLINVRDWQDDSFYNLDEFKEYKEEP